MHAPPARLRVAVDAMPLLGPRTGVGVFVDHLVRGLAAAGDLDVVGYGVTRVFLDDLRAALPVGVRTNRRRLPARVARAAWLRADGPPAEWFIGDVDVVHGTNFVVPPARRAAEVVTVHDLTPVRFPEMCDANTREYPRFLKRALARGAHVHAVSRYVAAEVVDVFGAAEDRVHAVHHGAPDRVAGDAAAGRARAGGDRYVLSIATVEPRKDLPLLVRAFDRVAADDNDVRLVLAGRDGWGAAVDALDDTIGLAKHRDRIVRTGWIEPSARADLLAGAAVLAYPSVYEGFGFPPLEAMQAGIPVVATSAGAVPEVVGDAALLVPVGDEDTLSAALTRVLGDSATHAQLVERGAAHAATYRWADCVDGLRAVYAAARSR
jgi:glycosyltransferase involved in cell wall biosynthesis